MSTLIAIFTLTFALILQTTIFVEMKLLNGAADIVLLILLSWILNENTEGHWLWGVIAGFLVGLVSEIPIWFAILSYLLVILVVHYLQSKIWQAPLVILFVSVTLTGFLLLTLNAIYLIIIGTPLPILDSLNLVILPSVILNMLFILPVYAIIGEIVKFVYPLRLEQ